MSGTQRGGYGGSLKCVYWRKCRSYTGQGQTRDLHEILWSYGHVQQSFNEVLDLAKGLRFVSPLGKMRETCKIEFKVMVKGHGKSVSEN